MNKIFMLLYLFRLLAQLNSIVYDCDALNEHVIHESSIQINGFNSFSEIIIECSFYFGNLDLIEITPKRALILDNSFNLNRIHVYSAPTNYHFSNLKGINLNLNLIGSLPSHSVSSHELFVTMINSKLDFYLSNSKRLENEDDCNSYRLKEPNFFTNLSKLELNYVVFSSKLCPMLFMSSKIDTLNIFSISNSFINRNRLFFMPINESNSKLLSLDIKSLQLSFHYESLSKEILNEHLFRKTEIILIICSNVIDVDQDLFKNNFYLHRINWHIENIRQFYYTTQNKWLESFVLQEFLFIYFVEIHSEFSFHELYDYPEEDFCLFIGLQNKDSIYSVIDPGKKINCSCTIIWTLKDTELYYEKTETNDYVPLFFSKLHEFPLIYCYNEPNFNDLIKHCDFKTKLKLCKTSEFSKANISENFLALNTDSDLANLIKFIQYILFVYFNQIFALIGILTNIIVVVVVANIKNLNKGKQNVANKKKDNMFKHILIHSAFNVFYCFIMAFKLINICLFFMPSLFCSSIANEIPAQWFKIVFIEYFGNIAKICCNVSYSAISISRIFLTGNNKKKGCLDKFNNLNIAIYLVLLVILSAVFSIFKFFQFSLNRLSLLDWSYIFSISKEIKSSCSIDFLYCEIWDDWMLLNNFVNYIFFFVFTILSDIAALANITRMINSKKKIVDNYKEEEEGKKRKRILKMIVINGIIFTLSHSPEFSFSILFLVFQNKPYFCSYFECSILNDIGQFFMYFSIMSQLSINYNFNKIFKQSFDNIIFKLKKKFIANIQQ